MRTTKPIATISYNTQVFLRNTLDRLQENGIIQFWAFIRHNAEEDETKAHYHVYCEPAKQVDTLWLQKQFIEIVIPPDGYETLLPEQVKPLKTMNWNSSKWVDWYWYGLHDVAYLAFKKLRRLYHYKKSDFYFSDVDEFEEKVRLNPCPVSELVTIANLINEGYDNMHIALALNARATNVHFILQNCETMRRYLDTGALLGLPNVEKKE